ncbi:hypothetical protein FO441_03115 [Salinicoccus cyprini]|uniref:Nuclear transport factor 2 family protein n=1 Tax=Salinicoccus cyprini TaxID=2493691 RepID=A0A558AYF3_9STAP|nr:hypothetical protein [Salinicoccus cyprini]TVT29288.1 hypothetical protein FO441_03115 [Salinicoccus cyprini]
MSSSRNRMKLIIPKGCDNAPRKQIVIDFTSALLEPNHEIAEAYAHDSVVWYQLKVERIIEGRRSLITALHDENTVTIDCLEIYQVITHGKSASINGLISYADGARINFCDVYVFSNGAKSGKVKEIRSYRL